MKKRTYEFIPADTTIEAYRVQIQALQRMGAEGRGRLTQQLCSGLRRTVIAGILQRHPNYSEAQEKLALIRLTAGEEVFRKLFPHEEISV